MKRKVKSSAKRLIIPGLATLTIGPSTVSTKSSKKSTETMLKELKAISKRRVTDTNEEMHACSAI